MKFYENVTCQDICFPHDSFAHVSCLLSVSYYDMDFVRDYESD